MVSTIIDDMPYTKCFVLRNTFFLLYCKQTATINPTVLIEIFNYQCLPEMLVSFS